MFHFSQLKSTFRQRSPGVGENTDDNSSQSQLVELRKDVAVEQVSSPSVRPLPSRTPAVRTDLQTQRSQLLAQLKDEIVADLTTALRPEAQKPMAPQQIIINNVATSGNSESPKKGKKSRNSWLENFRLFMESPVNRFAVIGFSGVGIWLVWSYLEHKWHMEAVQKKIDANILLRASQWAFNDTPKPLDTPARLFKW
jgi:hypothetical protein